MVKKTLTRLEVEGLFEMIIRDLKNLCYENKGAISVGKNKIGTIRYLLSVRLDALLGEHDE